MKVGIIISGDTIKNYETNELLKAKREELLLRLQANLVLISIQLFELVQAESPQILLRLKLTVHFQLMTMNLCLFYMI